MTTPKSLEALQATRWALLFCGFMVIVKTQDTHPHHIHLARDLNHVMGFNFFTVFNSVSTYLVQKLLFLSSFWQSLKHPHSCTEGLWRRPSEQRQTSPGAGVRVGVPRLLFNPQSCFWQNWAEPAGNVHANVVDLVGVLAWATRSIFVGLVF